MSKSRFVWEPGDIKITKRSTPSKQERRHPLAPKPYDDEKVREILSRMPFKTPGDGSSAEELPPETPLPIGEGAVEVWFFQGRRGDEGTEE